MKFKYQGYLYRLPKKTRFQKYVNTRQFFIDKFYRFLVKREQEKHCPYCIEDGTVDSMILIAPSGVSFCAKCGFERDFPYPGKQSSSADS